MSESQKAHKAASLFTQTQMQSATYLLGAFQFVLVVFYGLFGGSEVIKHGPARFTGTYKIAVSRSLRTALFCHI